MVKLADENGKTYVCGNGSKDFMRYSKERGFHCSDGSEWKTSSYEDVGLSVFIHINNWTELQPKEMSVNEIERVLGYPIKLKSNNNSAFVKWNNPLESPSDFEPVICKIKGKDGYYDGYYSGASCWIIKINNTQNTIYTNEILAWIYTADIKNLGTKYGSYRL